MYIFMVDKNDVLKFVNYMQIMNKMFAYLLNKLYFFVNSNEQLINLKEEHKFISINITMINRIAQFQFYDGNLTVHVILRYHGI